MQPLYILLIGKSTYEVKELMAHIGHEGDKVALVQDLQIAMYLMQFPWLCPDALIFDLELVESGAAIQVEIISRFIDNAREIQNLRPKTPIIIFSESNPVCLPGVNITGCDLGYIPKPAIYYQVARMLFALRYLKEVSP